MVLRNRISAVNELIVCKSHEKCNPMCSSNILNDPRKCRSKKQFEILFDFLGPAKYELNYWNSIYSKNSTQKQPNQFFLNIKEQLFVTLLRLRRGYNIVTLAHMYSVSEYNIRRIFTTWIMFLFHHFKEYEVLMFPPRQQFKQFLPSVFKNFTNIRCSVDCTEFFCEMPRDYGKQGNNYSSYKHHCTMKCLIAVNPHGAACFVSNLFEGSIDDVTIFQQCGILSFINPGDSLLVDKGFTIQDLLLPKQATIYIPAFFGKRKSLTKEELIAKARIHIERFNERLKKFSFINGTIPQKPSPIASQLVYVAACLVNFQDCLCK
ncbi:uncharacterized protein LOC100198014 [Hydra vulgaris]|uniref:uncharacterized protein LOC100198014 n=1 Tax=Hydra vulgaris TaxID=6087 RepID=UPI001F5EB58A|nr:uncharacterized protein LOC100198014 [Hydra vulgaris]